MNQPYPEEIAISLIKQSHEKSIQPTPIFSIKRLLVCYFQLKCIKHKITLFLPPLIFDRGSKSLRKEIAILIEIRRKIRSNYKKGSRTKYWWSSIKYIFLSYLYRGHELERNNDRRMKHIHWWNISQIFGGPLYLLYHLLNYISVDTYWNVLLLWLLIKKNK